MLGKCSDRHRGRLNESRAGILARRRKPSIEKAIEAVKKESIKS